LPTALLIVGTTITGAIGHTQSTNEIKLVNSYLSIKIEFSARYHASIAYFAQQYKYFFKKAIKYPKSGLQ
jgi:hypothetical protein